MVPGQVTVTFRPHLHHLGVILGADLRQVAARSAATATERASLGSFLFVTCGQQPHPGGQLRLHVDDPLAGSDELLSQQVAEPAGTLDRPRPLLERRRPGHQPLDLIGARADPQLAEEPLVASCATAS